MRRMQPRRTNNDFKPKVGHATAGENEDFCTVHKSTEHLRVHFPAFVKMVQEATSDDTTIEATLSTEQFSQIVPFISDDRRHSYTSSDGLFKMNNYPPFPSGAIRTPLERALTSAISNHGGNINNFSFLGSSLVTGFTGIHATGKKEGDLCIYKKTKAHSCEGVHAENNTFPILVLEIGFSENFDELRTDAAQWLDGSNRSVKAVILVKIHESTDRVHPLVLRADGEFVKTPTIHYYRPRLSENDQSELHPLSSVTYKDYRITGELRVDVEVWRPPSSEQVSRGDFDLELSSKRTLAHPSPQFNNDGTYFNLRLSDFDLVPHGGEDSELRVEIGR